MIDRTKVLGMVTTALHDILAERGVMIRSNAQFVMTDRRRAIVATIRDAVPDTLRSAGVTQLAEQLTADSEVALRVAAAAGSPPPPTRPQIMG